MWRWSRVRRLSHWSRLMTLCKVWGEVGWVGGGDSLIEYLQRLGEDEDRMRVGGLVDK